MQSSNGLPKTFPLRLPSTMWLQVTELARLDGISLNRFITQAIVEKIARLESVALFIGLESKQGSS